MMGSMTPKTMMGMVGSAKRPILDVVSYLALVFGSKLNFGDAKEKNFCYDGGEVEDELPSAQGAGTCWLTLRLGGRRLTAFGLQFPPKDPGPGGWWSFGPNSSRTRGGSTPSSDRSERARNTCQNTHYRMLRQPSPRYLGNRATNGCQWSKS